MSIKYILSRAEVKDIRPQFGLTLTVILQCVEVGIFVLVSVLEKDERGRVFWNRRRY